MSLSNCYFSNLLKFCSQFNDNLVFHSNIINTTSQKEVLKICNSIINGNVYSIPTALKSIHSDCVMVADKTLLALCTAFSENSTLGLNLKTGLIEENSIENIHLNKNLYELCCTKYWFKLKNAKIVSDEEFEEASSRFSLFAETKIVISEFSEQMNEIWKSISN